MLGPTAEVPLAAVRACFDANVFGLLELCQVSTGREGGRERQGHNISLPYCKAPAWWFLSYDT